MTYTLSPEARAKFVQIRQAKAMTQVELERATSELGSKVSLRTIQGLESGKRTVFHESTLLPLCKAMGIGIGELLGEQTTPPTPPSIEGGEIGPAPPSIEGGVVRRTAVRLTGQVRSPALLSGSKTRPLKDTAWLASGGLLGIILFSLIAYRIQSKNDVQRNDWILATDRQTFDAITPEWKDWNAKWEGKTSVMVFNYLEYPRVVHVGDTISGSAACSYRYIGGAPQVFLSLYAEWHPDREERLYEGLLSGDGTVKGDFRLQAPTEPGVYRLRLFYATSFKPVPSFYGAPPPNMVTSPSSGRYIEGMVEVLRVN